MSWLDWLDMQEQGPTYEDWWQAQFGGPYGGIGPYGGGGKPGGGQGTQGTPQQGQSAGQGTLKQRDTSSGTPPDDGDRINPKAKSLNDYALKNFGKLFSQLSKEEQAGVQRTLDFPQWNGGWMGFGGPEADLLSKSVSTGDHLVRAGGQMIGDSQESLTLAKNHYQRLLSGDSDATMRALQPQVRGILHQYDTAKRATGEFGPRGGGRNEAMQDIQFKEAGDVGTLIGGQATEAANKLRDIGAQFGYVGLGETGQGEASFMDTMRAIQQQQGLYLQSQGMGAAQDLAKSQQSAQMWQSIGQSAAIAIAMSQQNN